MKKLLIILGPTAAGKTDLALQLARSFDGELVACDSRQVYEGLDIGTGKLPGTGKWEVRRGKKRWAVGGVSIWMYDLILPNKQYNVADYVKDAERIIEDIIKRGKLPIVVGGTGLYLKALLGGIPNLEVPVDQKLRKELEKLSKEELQKKLLALSPIKFKSLNQSDRENPRRLLRFIELVLMNPYMRKTNKKQVTRNKFDALKIGLIAPREVLYEKVDLRVLDWICQGIVDEVKKLNKDGVSIKRFKELGLEYGVIADYLEGKVPEDQLVKIIQNNIHGYVRRQLTWFKKEKNVEWFDIMSDDYQMKIDNLVTDWYNYR